jgi:hypothetical protein
MSKTWSQAATEIKNWQTNNPGKPISFLIKAGEIAQLNGQTESGMDAIKVYLGSDANGVITAYFVGAVSDGGTGFNDYGIPVTLTAFNNALSAGTIPLKRDALPCPTQCGTNNYLNS